MVHFHSCRINCRRVLQPFSYAQESCALGRGFLLLGWQAGAHFLSFLVSLAEFYFSARKLSRKSTYVLEYTGNFLYKTFV